MRVRIDFAGHRRSAQLGFAVRAVHDGFPGGGRDAVACDLVLGHFIGVAGVRVRIDFAGHGRSAQLSFAVRAVHDGFPGGGRDAVAGDLVFGHFIGVAGVGVRVDFAGHGRSAQLGFAVRAVHDGFPSGGRDAVACGLVLGHYIDVAGVGVRIGIGIAGLGLVAASADARFFAAVRAVGGRGLFPLAPIVAEAGDRGRGEHVERKLFVELVSHGADGRIGAGVDGEVQLGKRGVGSDGVKGGVGEGDLAVLGVDAEVRRIGGSVHKGQGLRVVGDDDLTVVGSFGLAQRDGHVVVVIGLARGGGVRLRSSFGRDGSGSFDLFKHGALHADLFGGQFIGEQRTQSGNLPCGERINGIVQILVQHRDVRCIRHSADVNGVEFFRILIGKVNVIDRLRGVIRNEHGIVGGIGIPLGITGAGHGVCPQIGADVQRVDLTNGAVLRAQTLFSGGNGAVRRKNVHIAVRAHRIEQEHPSVGGIVIVADEGDGNEVCNV